MRKSALVILAALLPQSSLSQDLDDILAGFDDPLNSGVAAVDPGASDTLSDVLAGFEQSGAAPLTSDQTAAEFELTSEQPFRISGILAQRIVANIGGQAAPHDGLSSLRSQLNLTADFTLPGSWRGRVAGHGFFDTAFGVNGRLNYPTAFLDIYESDLELGEAYVQGALSPDLDLKLGRQIVVWGKSDMLRVTDILNPLDKREPGLTDIRDLRLPVTMAKLDFYFGNWNFSAMAIPETRFNKMPVFGSDFFPGAGPAPVDDQPGEGFGSTEYALALNGTFTGWDLSLYGASVFNDAPHAVATSAGLRRRHARLSMAGASANIGAGNWLLKGEAAMLDGLQFLNAPGRSFSRLDMLVGFDYTGFSWGTVTMEAANRHILGFDPVIAGGPEDARKDDFEIALRAATSLMNDRLDLSAVVSVQGVHGENGGFQRLEASYDISDQAKVKFGGVNYVSGNKVFFQNIGDNDRVYAKFEFRF